MVALGVGACSQPEATPTVTAVQPTNTLTPIVEIILPIPTSTATLMPVLTVTHEPLSAREATSVTKPSTCNLERNSPPVSGGKLITLAVPEVNETLILIDGQPDDWIGRPVLFQDPTGDGKEGFLDLTTGYAFVNQHALYFLVNSVDASALVQRFWIDIQVGSRHVRVEWTPEQPRANHEQVENSSMEISNELSKIKKLR